MKKRFLLLLCLTACLQTGWAQNTMESIRQRYAAAKEYIATHQGTNESDGAEWAEYYHVEARQFLPGTGGHKENTYMYFNEREEDKIYPSHYLYFATSSYNFSALDYQEEYLYYKDGKVAFIYAHNPYWAYGENEKSMEFEFRFYFNRGKLLRAIVKSRDNNQQAFRDVYSGATIKNEYADIYRQHVSKAEKIRQMFIAIEKEAYDYSE